MYSSEVWRRARGKSEDGGGEGESRSTSSRLERSSESCYGHLSELDLCKILH